MWPILATISFVLVLSTSFFVRCDIKKENINVKLFCTENTIDGLYISLNLFFYIIFVVSLFFILGFHFATFVICVLLYTINIKVSSVSFSDFFTYVIDCWDTFVLIGLITAISGIVIVVILGFLSVITTDSKTDIKNENINIKLVSVAQSGEFDDTIIYLLEENEGYKYFYEEDGSIKSAIVDPENCEIKNVEDGKAPYVFHSKSDQVEYYKSFLSKDFREVKLENIFDRYVFYIPEGSILKNVQTNK